MVKSSSAGVCLSLLTLLHLMAVAHGIRNLHAWNSLFQSDASVHFPSDHSLSTAHDNYLTSIGHDQYAHSRRRHPFIVKFPAGCGIVCHEALKARVGSGRHSVLSASYAQVMVKTEDIGALQAHLGEDVILDYVAMLPALKIERKTHTVSQQDTTCGISSAGGRVFQAVLAPQEQSGLASVQSLLEDVVVDFSSYAGGSGSIVVSLRIDPVGLKAREENIVTFEVGCSAGSDATATVAGSVISQLVDSIAALPFVLWVEHREPMKMHNRWATGLCQSGTAGSTPMFDTGLDGNGIVVGVSDTGIDMTHSHFYDANVSAPYDVINHTHRKVVTYIAYADSIDDEDGHGTHVSSTVAGKSNIRYGDFIKYDGNAREAKIAFFDIGRTSPSSLTTPGNLNSGILQPLREAGARVSTHSWGSTQNGYTTDARNVDSFMVAFPDSLVLFAAGNDGFSVGAGSVGSPSTNKNGISVGASINSYDVMRAVMGPDIDASLYSDASMAGFSSVGPTSDGRMKPDLAAPGWYTVAAEALTGAGNDHSDVKTLRGTSMASPTMAGNAVLVQQYFNEGYYPSGSKNPADAFVPSGALLKAMLVHSGKALDTVTYDDETQTSTGGYPSNIQGYGKIRLSDVLNFGESTNDPISLFVKGDVNESSPMYASLQNNLAVDKYYIVAPPSSSPSSPIRVTMTYTDQMGTAGSSHPLVNDLELRVRLGGNVFYPYKNSDSDINNIEMIDILDPCAGCNYTIEVRAVDISTVQPYALVASGILTAAVSNVTSTGSSSTSDNNESIDPETWNIIIVLGLLCLFLGGILVFLHKFDKLPPPRRHHKTFAEEQAEQAEALRYYEEQNRQRRAGERLGDESSRQGGSRRRRERRAGEDGGSVTADQSGRKKKKKKDRSREREGGVEMARQQDNIARL